MRFRITAILTCVLLQLAGCGKTKNPPAVSTAVSPVSASQAPTENIPVARADSTSVAAGTPIEIEMGEALDSGALVDTRFVLGKVASDVKGPDGRLAIPARASALMVVHEAGKNGNISRVVLGLNRVEVAGRVFRANELSRDIALVTLEENAADGAAHRTVHLNRQSRLTFKTENAIQSR